MKKSNQKGKAYNIYLNDNIAQRIDEMADQMGISRSALISVMANQYIQGIDTINVLKATTSLIEKEVKLNG